MSDPAQISNLSQDIPAVLAPIHAPDDIVQKMGPPNGKGDNPVAGDRQ